MDTLRDKRLLESLWDERATRRGQAVRELGLLARPADVRHRRDRARRRLAGASGSLEAGRRRRLPGARLGAAARAGARRPARARHGRPRRRARPGAAGARARRVRDRHRLPPRGADDRRRSPTATRSRPSRRTSPGTWALLEACRRSPRVKQVVVASSDKAYGEQDELPYDEETPLAGPAPLRRQQVVRRPDRADLRRHLRAAGGDHALRQLLRRRRPELEPHRARHDPLGAARPAAGHPLRRPVRARLLLRRGRRRGVHAARRAARGGSRAARRGVQLLERDAGHRLGARRADPGADGVATSSPTSATRRATRSATSTSTRRRRARALGWAPLFTLDEGLRADDRLVPRRSSERPRDACATSLPLVRRPATSSRCSRSGETPLANSLLDAGAARRARADVSRSSSPSARAARSCRSPRRCRRRCCSATTSTSRPSPTRCSATRRSSPPQLVAERELGAESLVVEAAEQRRLPARVYRERGRARARHRAGPEHRRGGARSAASPTIAEFFGAELAARLAARGHARRRLPRQQRARARRRT